jgi:peptidyl-prolyl cis-trans isomerase SurA
MNYSTTAAAVLLTILAGLSQSQGDTSFGIAAVINGKVITTSEVREAVEAQRAMISMTVRDPAEQERRLRELEDQALFALLERELILTEFAKMGGTIKREYVEDSINEIIRDNFQGDREKFIAELAKQNMTPKKFRELREKMIVVQVMRQRHTKETSPPTPAQVEAFYAKHADKFREKDFIKISTITMPKYAVGDANSSPETQKKLLEEIRTKISGGSDFALLAKANSQDSHADEGGAWDWIERSQMDKQVADVAFALKPGAISKVVDVGPSYMIILCDARRPGATVPLEKIRPEIEKSIQAETGKSTMIRWTRGMASKASITPEATRARFMEYLARE